MIRSIWNFSSKLSLILTVVALVADSSAQTTSPCPNNFVWDPALKGCQECPQNTVYNASSRLCVATTGQDPHCPVGFQYDSVRLKCLDVDECNQKGNICQIYEFCINTEGSFQCRERVDYCGQGFRFNKSSHECKDIDECADNLHGCHSPYHCFNIVGSFECRPTCPDEKKYYYHSECNECQEGFYFSRKAGQCKDVDECLDGPFKILCQPYKEKCVTRPGLSTCERHCSGGTVDYLGQCYDIDECSNNSHNCSGTQKCMNEFGSFGCIEIRCRRNEKIDPASRECVCKAGYRFHTYRQECVDIDECQVMQKACGLHGECINTVGGHQCLCDPGFQEVNGSCHDIDECRTMEGICGYLDCQNALGKYACVCPAGYRMSAEALCEDIDECTENRTICHSLLPNEKHECFNLIGTFKCVNVNCPIGYRRLSLSGSVRKCQLLDKRCSFRNQEGCFQEQAENLIYEVVQIKEGGVGPHTIGYINLDSLQYNNYGIRLSVKKSVGLTGMSAADLSNAITISRVRNANRVAIRVERSLPNNSEIMIDVRILSQGEFLKKVEALYQFYIFVKITDG